MLWTDRDFVTIADLTSVDADIVDTAAANDITLDGDGGMIQRGIEDAGRTLEVLFISFATFVASQDISAQHLTALFYTGASPNNRRRFELEQIVVSGRSPRVWSELKQWVVNQILIAFYRTASSRAENDRYEEKYKLFEDRDRRKLWPGFRQSGAPVVSRPMPAPAAKWGTNPGSWVAATAVDMAGTATGSYSVAVTYVDLSRYQSEAIPANAQSAASEPQTVALTSGHVLTADITNLNPPTGSMVTELLSRAVVVPLNATGWNLWAGTGGVLRLQNSTPIPIATKTYTLTGDPSTTSAVLTEGQYPESFPTLPDVVQRG